MNRGPKNGDPVLILSLSVLEGRGFLISTTIIIFVAVVVAALLVAVFYALWRFTDVRIRFRLLGIEVTIEGWGHVRPPPE